MRHPADDLISDLEPKNLKHHDIYRLLDLAATEEDQHEVCDCPAASGLRLIFVFSRSSTEAMSQCGLGASVVLCL